MGSELRATHVYDTPAAARYVAAAVVVSGVFHDNVVRVYVYRWTMIDVQIDIEWKNRR